MNCIESAKWVKDEIWPKIHALLPQLECHVYGEYPDRESMNSSIPEINFYVKGPAKDVKKMFRKYLINLAPLRFGAGIKGLVS